MRRAYAYAYILYVYVYVYMRAHHGVEGGEEDMYVSMEDSSRCKIIYIFVYPRQARGYATCSGVMAEVTGQRQVSSLK